ncbi:MAG: hypothetical protein GX173_09160 [Ruminococcaceae bacterium]|jgi:hypothetical protein|nr:hypothetical protein [Oscillospiraceae bacterium]
MAKVRDRFWLWGHPENRYFNEYGNYRHSRMTPMEGASYLGVQNTFMVPVGVKVNPRQYNKSFRALQQVGWSIDNAATSSLALESLIENAKEFPNITCGVFDDFVGQRKTQPVPVERFEAVNKRMHQNEVRPLDMWMVLYTHEFGVDQKEDQWLQPYIGTFDGIIMWTWQEKDVVLFEEKFEIFKRLTAGKRRMLGLYLWNFGEHKEATAKAVQWQLDRYHQLLVQGEVEGIVLHTNTMADLDYEAYDVAVAWMLKHGDEEIS